ncbi:hypothetical protein QLX08_000967 [Tetragonisca angustula]|uniref:Uncharacterized protein n=1 Tax=Tetragonisca angustula TaxID=166442 RepID=A0AAW1AKL1_9HYME
MKGDGTMEIRWKAESVAGNALRSVFPGTIGYSGSDFKPPSLPPDTMADNLTVLGARRRISDRAARFDDEGDLSIFVVGETTTENGRPMLWRYREIYNMWDKCAFGRITRGC